jgi:hypothetical protein
MSTKSMTGWRRQSFWGHGKANGICQEGTDHGSARDRESAAGAGQVSKADDEKGTTMDLK